MQSHELPPPVRMIELLGGFRISQALWGADLTARGRTVWF
jgi:hypothetical protein